MVLSMLSNAIFLWPALTDLGATKFDVEMATSLVCIGDEGAIKWLECIAVLDSWLMESSEMHSGESGDSVVSLLLHSLSEHLLSDCTGVEVKRGGDTGASLHQKHVGLNFIIIVGVVTDDAVSSQADVIEVVGL